jgi:arsenate reductase (thioredoxin)
MAIQTKVAFICVGNSCRSQMAEGFANHYGSDAMDSYSAGTEPAEEINPNAVLVMKEAGVDISAQYPKLLKDIPSELDIVITMGCNVQCPFIPSRHREDWGLEDPVGKPVEEFRKTRDIIMENVKQLLERINKQEI